HLFEADLDHCRAKTDDPYSRRQFAYQVLPDGETHHSFLSMAVLRLDFAYPLLHFLEQDPRAGKNEVDIGWNLVGDDDIRRMQRPQRNPLLEFLFLEAQDRNPEDEGK